MKKQIVFGIVFLLSISLASAAPLSVQDILNVSYGGTMSNAAGNYGAIHFLSNGDWAGTLQNINSNVYFDKGSTGVGNLEIQFAGQSGSQSYSAGNITLRLNATGVESDFIVVVPAATIASGNLQLFVDSLGSTFYDQSMNSLAASAPGICYTDAQCGTSSENNVYLCLSKGTIQSLCVNGDPNLDGTVTDVDYGLNVSGANVSFYSTSACLLDEVSLSGSCTSTQLNPKERPDLVTGADGKYSVFLPIGDYHIVVQHSKQVDHNVKANNSGANKTKVEHEVKEGIDAKNLNFEGHIQYGGNYRGGNKYLPGDLLIFKMFGVNHDTQPATVSYLIERHVAGVDNGANGPWVLNGSFANSAETLTVPADGNKVNKQFSFIVPNFELPGRYDIHVLYNESGSLEKWHKIGNFFVLNASEISTEINPPLAVFNTYATGPTNIETGNYVNQTATAPFFVRIPPVETTINGILYAQNIFIQVLQDCSFGPEGDEVTFSAPGGEVYFQGSYYSNELKVNLTNGISQGCNATVGFRYPESKKYHPTITFTERNLHKNTTLVANVSMWATEQQARDIYFDIVEQSLSRPANKYVNFTGYYAGDRNPLVGAGGYGAFNGYNVLKTHSTPIYYYVEADLFDTTWGFEYRSDQDGKDVGTLNYPTYCSGDTDVNLLGATACERDALNANWQADISPYYVLVLEPRIVDEVAQSIIQFGDFLVANGHTP